MQQGCSPDLACLAARAGAAGRARKGALGGRQAVGQLCTDLGPELQENSVKHVCRFLNLGGR